MPQSAPRWNTSAQNLNTSVLPSLPPAIPRLAANPQSTPSGAPSSIGSASWHGARNSGLDPSVIPMATDGSEGSSPAPAGDFRPSRSVAFLVLPRQITAPLGAVFLHPAIKAISRFLDFHYSWGHGRREAAELPAPLQHLPQAAGNGDDEIGLLDDEGHRHEGGNPQHDPVVDPLGAPVRARR